MLGSPLAFLVSYLAYAAKHLPHAYSAAALLVQDPANASRLKQQVLDSPLDFLVTYLEYAAMHLPHAYSAAVEVIQDVANRKYVAGSIIHSQLDKLVCFLKHLEGKNRLLAVELLQGIDLKAWNIARRNLGTCQPNFMHAFAIVSQRLGRPDLGQFPSEMLIRAAETKHWHISGITSTNSPR